MTTRAFLNLSPNRTWRVWLVGILLYLPLLLAGCSLVTRRNEPPPPPPLIKAVSKGDTATVRALLAKGADVQARDANGRTALMYAAENGDPTTVQALLTNGADVNARDSQGWTALVYAAENGDITTVQTLHSRDVTVFRDRKSTRLNSSHLGNLVCRLLLEKKKPSKRGAGGRFSRRRGARACKQASADLRARRDCVPLGAFGSGKRVAARQQTPEVADSAA